MGLPGRRLDCPGWELLWTPQLGRIVGRRDFLPYIFPRLSASSDFVWGWRSSIPHETLGPVQSNSNCLLIWYQYVRDLDIGRECEGSIDRRDGGANRWRDKCVSKVMMSEWEVDVKKRLGKHKHVECLAASVCYHLTNESKHFIFPCFSLVE